MPGLFYNLGRMLGPKVRKAGWVWHSVTGSEADAIQAEQAVGRDMAAQVCAESGVDRSGRTSSEVQAIGKRLASRLTDRRRTFHLDVLLSPEVNAFALPGGFIFITRPLAELLASDEHEWAFVIGHEMAHIVRGHAVDRILNDSALKMASRLSIASRAMRSKAVRIGLDLMTKAYSQEQELEADAFAARLARSASVDPAGGLRVMEKLRRAGDGSGDSFLGEYFSSHPSFEMRTSALRQQIRKMQRS